MAHSWEGLERAKSSPTRAHCQTLERQENDKRIRTRNSTDGERRDSGGSYQVHNEGGLAGSAKADGDGHGERADSGGEDGENAEEERHVAGVRLEADHGVEGDGVDHRRQHAQQQPIQRRCNRNQTNFHHHAQQM